MVQNATGQINKKEMHQWLLKINYFLDQEAFELQVTKGQKNILLNHHLYACLVFYSSIAVNPERMETLFYSSGLSSLYSVTESKTGKSSNSTGFKDSVSQSPCAQPSNLCLTEVCLVNKEGSFCCNDFFQEKGAEYSRHLSLFPWLTRSR